MTSIWDVHLDAADAAVMVDAIEVLERHRSWEHEREDRELEAGFDGGRWGSPDASRRLRDAAAELAAGSSRIASAATRAGRP